jgi:exodeoxyribonuclease-5
MYIYDYDLDDSQVLDAITHLSSESQRWDTDGVGFSAQDKDLGIILSENINLFGSLSDPQMAIARKLLGKYKKQVANFLDIAARPLTSPFGLVLGNKHRQELGDRLVITEPTNIYHAGLNDGQRKAFDRVLDWYRSGESFHVLSGAAGTGKSFLAARIVKAIQSIYPRHAIGLTATTHKACSVLGNFAKENRINSKVGTIYRKLGITLDRNGEGDLAIPENTAPKTFLEDLIICDESSMIEAELLSLITDRSKVLFLGDRFQLPSVKDGKISPVFSLQSGSELTEVVRYAGSILRLATNIREDMESRFLPNFCPDDSLKRLGSYDWMGNLIQTFESNPNTRALAWTNQRVSSINRELRHHFYGEDCKQFEIGEILIAKEPIKTENGEFWFDTEDQEHKPCYDWVNTADELRVLDTFSTHLYIEELHLEAQAWRLDLDHYGNTIEVNALDLDRSQEITKALNTWKKAIISEKDLHLRKKKWRDFYSVCDRLSIKPNKNLYLTKLSPAFAQTVHQSQGSTFDHVFMDYRNISNCPDFPLRNQLLYVAATRASQSLTILK